MEGLFDNLDLPSDNNKPKVYRVQEKETKYDSDSDADSNTGEQEQEQEQEQKLSRPVFDLSKSTLFNKSLTETQLVSPEKSNCDTEELPNHPVDINENFSTIEDSLNEQELSIINDKYYDDYEGHVKYILGESKRDKILLKLYPFNKLSVNSDEDHQVAFERYLKMLKYNTSAIVREQFWKVNNPQAYEKRQLEKQSSFGKLVSETDNENKQHSPSLTSKTQPIISSTLNDTQHVSCTISDHIQTTQDETKYHQPSINDSDSEDEIVTKRVPRHIENMFEENSDHDNNDHESKSALDVSLIKDYKNMTVQEKILARVKEKEKLRVEKEEQETSLKKSSQKEFNDSDDEDNTNTYNNTDASSKILTKKQQEAQQISEKVRLNERIKQGTHIHRTDNPDKFNISKFINAFNEPDSSDDEDIKVFPNKKTAVSNTSSPSHFSKTKPKNSMPNKLTKYDVSNSKYSQFLKAKSDGLITLDGDDSDDDIEIIKLSTDKKTLFELKEKLAKKSNQKKDTKKIVSKTKHLRNILRKEKEKQMLELKSNRKAIRPEDAELEENEDQMIEKLIRDEIARAEKIKKDEEAKRQSRKTLKREPDRDDEPDFSDEYSDDGDDETGNDSTDSQEEEGEDSNDEEGDKGSQKTQEISSSDPSVAFGKPAFKKGPLKSIKESHGLSQFFSSTLPGNNEFEGLNSLEIAKKLKDNEVKNNIMDDDMNDHSGIVIDENAGVNSNDEEMDNSEISRSIITIEQPSATQKLVITQNDDDLDEFENSQTLMMKKHLLDSQNFLPDTQADETINSRETSFSVGPDNYQFTQADSFTTNVDTNSVDKLDSDMEEARTKIKENSSEEPKDEEEDDDEEDEETKLQRAATIKKLRRLDEKRRRKKEREFKSKGLNKIMENEAEESEDEYHGLGGRDGENSDIEDSEDEKMLDDGTLIHVDENEMRARMAQEGIDLDNALVKKIYGDLKSGAFRKRRGKDGAYSLDLEEDQTERIVNYYKEMRRKQEEARKRENLNYDSLSKDDKTKAFSATMLDRKINTDSFQFEEKVESEEESNNEEENDNDPFIEKAADTSGISNDLYKSTKTKKRRMLTEEQIRKTISFIDDDAYDVADMEIAEFSDDGIEEIQALKQNSIVTRLTSPDHYKKKRKLLVKQQSRKERKLMIASSSKSKVALPKANKLSNIVLSGDDENNEDLEPLPQKDDEEEIADTTVTSITSHNGNDDSFEIDDDDGVGLLCRRSTSITDSFKLHKKRIFSANGKQLRDIQVTTSSRSVSHTKGSVTYLTNDKKFGNGGISGDNGVKSGKLSKIEEGLRAARKQNSLKSLYNTGFN